MQRMMGLVRRCIEDYRMIEPGDRIAVGVSGGKDSLTLLTLLAALREYVPCSYDLTAITIDMGLGGMDFSPVARLCERLGVPYSRVETDIGRICLQHGTMAAAVGVVVHLILPVRSVIPDLVRFDAENAALLRAAEDGLAQHVADGVREERHDINSHRLPFLRSGAGAHSPRQREFRGRIP